MTWDFQSLCRCTLHTRKERQGPLVRCRAPAAKMVLRERMAMRSRFRLCTHKLPWSRVVGTSFPLVRARANIIPLYHDRTSCTQNVQHSRTTCPSCFRGGRHPAQTWHCCSQIVIGLYYSSSQSVLRPVAQWAILPALGSSLAVRAFKYCLTAKGSSQRLNFAP